MLASLRCKVLFFTKFVGFFKNNFSHFTFITFTLAHCFTLISKCRNQRWLLWERCNCFCVPPLKLKAVLALLPWSLVGLNCNKCECVLWNSRQPSGTSQLRKVCTITPNDPELLNKCSHNTQQVQQQCVKGGPDGVGLLKGLLTFVSQMQKKGNGAWDLSCSRQCRC